MHSPEHWPPLLGRTVVWMARRSLEAWVGEGRIWQPAPAEIPAELLEWGASFVTLKRGLADLRGCIGSVEARRPLVEDIVANARSAASRDPRFPPVGRDELPGLNVSVNVLTPPEPLFARSEQQLLALLKPGMDGLILEAPGGRRATYLPSVWAQLPEPEIFLRELKRKAGLPEAFWSPDLAFHRYGAFEFSEAPPAG